MARELTWYQPSDKPYENFLIRKNEILDTRRWVSTNVLVISPIGNPELFYRTYYDKGLTEYQDQQPFEYADEVVFRRVEKVEVMTIEYREPK